MAWIRIDDQMPDHPKIEPLSDAAFRWIFRGLSYANRFLTDGVLPPAFLAKCPDTYREELVNAGVWKVDRATRVRIHDYRDYQPSKADVERERKRNRERQARWRESHGSNAVTKHNGVTNNAPSRPVPARTTKRSPQPPVGTGGSMRILKRHRKEADLIWKRTMGQCHHTPHCVDSQRCYQLTLEAVAGRAS